MNNSTLNDLLILLLMMIPFSLLIWAAFQPESNWQDDEEWMDFDDDPRFWE